METTIRGLYRVWGLGYLSRSQFGPEWVCIVSSYPILGILR